jgi:Ca2+-binding EF-hand superfamily protein
MKILTPALLALTGMLLLFSAGSPAADQPKAKPDVQVTDEVHDFVFLGESRPVLVRLHVQTDGRKLQAAWDDCIDYLFKYLDVNGDGVLTKDEIERAPTPEQFTGDGGGLGGFGRRGGQPTVKFEVVDADGDGKVTRAELAAYYRKNGFTPFQFNFSNGPANPLGAFAALLGGGRSEPSVDAVSKAIFDLLDTEKNGKLTLKQLEAAERVLLQMDEDEDEVVTTREIAPNENGNVNQLAMMMAMGGGGREKATSSPLMVPVLKTGEVPADLVSRMMERYGPKEKQKRELSRKDIGLDEATFRKLDANNDGVLDADELGGLVKRTPDIEFTLRLGKKKDTEGQVEVVTGDGRSPLGGKFEKGLLDLGLTRAELRAYDAENYSDAARITTMRQDYLNQFRQVAKDDGTADATAAKGNQRLNRLFKAMDRDGDGKLTEKKVTAYFDHLAELQKRVAAGSVTLTITNQSRGLFDLLDTNRDGRLSVREMRQAPKLLKQFDRDNKGYLTADDLPHTYRLEVRRASFVVRDNNGLAAVTELYAGAYETPEGDGPQRGPVWFRKMDRNRDGDVSRKEWLFSDELFKKIDLDGDGLISVEEAEKADELFRKELEKQNR